MIPPAEFDWMSLVVYPDISNIEIEDGGAAANLYSEKQQRLLTESLYSSWAGPRAVDGSLRPYLATANVGVFASPHEPALVPDVLLSVDVQVHPDATHDKKHMTYFIWEMGKAPDVVIEVVSNRKGGELGKRKQGYERIGVPYFIVWDPERLLRERELMAYAISPIGYIPMTNVELPRLSGLSLRPWDGSYEGLAGRWLRWFDDGVMIPTGAERADAEQQRADTEQQRAEAAEQRVEAAEQRVARLAALLAAHGLNDDST